MRYATYTLRIEVLPPCGPLSESEREELFSGIQNAEDAVNDALPEGFYCKIDEVDMGVVRKIAESEDVPC